jgi:putative aldouronate transport system permease protein
MSTVNVTNSEVNHIIINKKKSINKQQLYILLLAAPGLIWYLVFKYLPLIGLSLAFTDYGFKQKVSFVGLDNFHRLLITPGYWQALKNTLLISAYTIVFYFPIPIILALLMNEIVSLRRKKFVQFVVYIPYFFSWAVVGSIFVTILSPSTGIVNEIIKFFGGDPIYFMASEKWFRSILVGSNIWKSAGFGTVIYIAALTSIDPQLYEAAVVDGANHWHKLFHITLPSLKPTIATMLLLTVSTILLMFEQIFVMYSPSVFAVSDVLQTFSFREGLLNQDIGFATAIGLFTSIFSTIFVFGTNKLSKVFLKEEII